MLLAHDMRREASRAAPLAGEKITPRHGIAMTTQRAQMKARIRDRLVKTTAQNTLTAMPR